MAPKTLEQKLVIGTAIGMLGAAFLAAKLYEVDLPAATSINVEHQPTMGNPLSPLEITIFLDPKCPNCARYHEEVVPELKYVWVETNYAKLVMVPVCFLAGSRPAGMALLEVHHQNPDLFFPYLELVFKHQAAEEEDWCTSDLLKGLAAQIDGIDSQQVQEAVVSARYAAALDHNLAVALETMHGELVTPSAYVEGMAVRQPSFDAINDLCEKTLSYYGID
jgi:protein-disulfide isomerase